ncbi:MAG: ABC transporter ATP-binding protein [Pseudonocardia sp.]|nr:MAG: ABC transporter ATP-binding protein [Pseudonocardia sp.]
MLEAHRVSKTFGGVSALDDVSFRIDSGELVGVIGPNGSGKSTLINVITGFYPPTSGDVLLNGASIAGAPPAAIRAKGVVRTFQNLRLVDEMTVLENTIAGTYLETVAGGGLVWNTIAAVLGFRAARSKEKLAYEKATAALEAVGLHDKRQLLVSKLSYGDQKRLEIARALAIRPKLLILDEPTAGMGEAEAEELIGLTAALARDTEHSMCVFLVEHRLELVLQISDRAIVMDGGRIVADGAPQAVGADPHVRRIYVGGE